MQINGHEAAIVSTMKPIRTLVALTLLFLTLSPQIVLAVDFPDAGAFLQRVAHEQKEHYRKTLEQVANNSQSTDIQRLQANCELAFIADKLEVSRETFTLASTAAGQDVKIANLYARYLANTGNLVEAQRVVSASLLKNPTNIDAKMLSAIVSNEALSERAKQLQALAESDDYALIALAKIAYKSGDFGLVLQASARYLEKHNCGPAYESHLPQALKAKALVELNGDKNELMKSLESAISQKPNDPNLMSRLWAEKFEAKQYESAIRLAEQNLVGRENEFEPLVCLARTLFAANTRLAEVKRLLETALVIRPDDEDATVMLSLCLAQQKDFETAKRLIATYVRRHPTPKAYLILASIILIDPNPTLYESRLAQKISDSLMESGGKLSHDQKKLCIGISLKYQKWQEARQRIAIFSAQASDEERREFATLSELIASSEKIASGTAGADKQPDTKR